MKNAMLCRNADKSLISSDGATGARRLVGARPVEHAVFENFTEWGSRGHAPLGCLPLWGREGVTLANSPEVRYENDFTRAERKKSMKREQEMSGEMTKEEAGTVMNRWNRETGIRP
jgi:hypothetical protein